MKNTSLSEQQLLTKNELISCYTFILRFRPEEAAISKCLRLHVDDMKKCIPVPVPKSIQKSVQPKVCDEVGEL